MSDKAAPRVLLIDLDNCPAQLAQLSEPLSSFSRVIACHGGRDPKVPLSLVPFLATALHERRLEIVPMKQGGKHAADFALAFWAGRLSADLPADTEFIFVSHDRDLDHVVGALQGLGRRARRLDGLPAPTRASHGELERHLREYEATQLVAGSPPARRSTLLSSVRAFCEGRKGADPDALFDALIAREIVTIDDRDRVTYGASADEIPF